MPPGQPARRQHRQHEFKNLGEDLAAKAMRAPRLFTRGHDSAMFWPALSPALVDRMLRAVALTAAVAPPAAHNELRALRGWRPIPPRRGRDRGGGTSDSSGLPEVAGGDGGEIGAAGKQKHDIHTDDKVWVAQLSTLSDTTMHTYWARVLASTGWRTTFAANSQGSLSGGKGSGKGGGYSRHDAVKLLAHHHQHHRGPHLLLQARRVAAAQLQTATKRERRLRRLRSATNAVDLARTPQARLRALATFSARLRAAQSSDSAALREAARALGALPARAQKTIMSQAFGPARAYVQLARMRCCELLLYTVQNRLDAAAASEAAAQAENSRDALSSITTTNQKFQYWHKS